MSNVLPPLASPAAYDSKRNAILPPISTISASFRTHDISSSPPPSSSPLHTPYSTKTSRDYAYVRSVPKLRIPDHPRDFRGFDTDNYASAWQLPMALNRRPDGPFSLPHFKSAFPEDDDFMYLSCSDVFEIPASEEPTLPLAQSRDTSPSHNSAYDAEDDELEEDEESEVFVASDARATFFRISAERGRWRHDPVPIVRQAHTEVRKSVPSWSSLPVSGIQLATRPISEPAPSTSRVPSPSGGARSHASCNDPVAELPSTSFPDHTTSSDRHVSCDPLPSLVSDRDTSPEPEPPYLSSPLPPSSPPLSPLHPSSPLSLLPSSPPPPLSSPLVAGADTDDDVPELELKTEMEEIPSQLQDLLTPREGIDSNAENDDAVVGQSRSGSQASMSGVPSVSSSSETTASKSDVYNESLAPSTHPDLASSMENAVPMPEPPKSVMNSPALLLDSGAGTELSEILGAPDDLSITTAPDAALTPDNGPGPISDIVDDRVDVPKMMDHQQESGHVLDDDAEERRAKRRRDTASINGSGESARKKARTKGRETVDEKGKAKGVDGRTRDEKADEERTTHSRVKKAKKVKAHTSKGKVSRPLSRSHDADVDSSEDSDSDPEPAPKPSPKSSKKRKPMDAETAEICGLLVESMATSRASCLPVSSLYKSVMQSRPSLKAQKSEKEWIEVFNRVLADGEGGVFGKVESSGMDENDRPLEAQWFYVPEMDEDQERAMLVRSMMPRPGKRSTTKKYKQYYYRPLEKISKWDPEDEI